MSDSPVNLGKARAYKAIISDMYQHTPVFVGCILLHWFSNGSYTDFDAVVPSAVLWDSLNIY